MKKIYIACALTYAPEDFIEQVNKLKDNLRKEYEVLNFIGLKNGTAKDVYEHDIKCVLMSDIVVAICDYPAIGLGYELSLALEKYSKPTLALVHKDIKLSRLVEGINHPMFTLKKYDSADEISGFIKEKELQHFKAPVSVNICEGDVCVV